MTVVVLCPQDFPLLWGMPFLEAGPLQAVGIETQTLSTSPGTWRESGATGAFPGVSQCHPSCSRCPGGSWQGHRRM